MNQYDISLIDLKGLLLSLNIRNLKEHDSYFTGSCPSGNHLDKHPSWVVYKNTGVHKCFSCGFQGTLNHLVKYITGQSLQKYLNLPDYESYQFKNTLNKKVLKENTFNRKVFQNRTFKEIEIKGNKESIYDYNHVMQELKRRKIHSKFINDFNLFYAKYLYINNTLYKDRLCIPIYYENKLVNVEGRALTPDNKPKVLYCKGGTTNFLFNYDNLDLSKPVYLVEGIMDIVQIYENISTNVTCSFGISLSTYQKELIQKIPQLIVIPDKDKGGEKFINLIDKIYTEREYWIVSLPNYKDDPNNVSLEVLKKAIDNKEKAIDYFLNKIQLFPNKPINW